MGTYHGGMPHTSYADRRRLESLDRAALAEHQLARLNRMLERVLPANAFYRQKLEGLPWRLPNLEVLNAFPFTYKQELVSAQELEGGCGNRTFPTVQYVRYHQTSGTRGRPLSVLDTADDWEWWLDTWQYILDAAGVDPRDCVLTAFSFGPFIGFWTAYEAAAARGCLMVPGGGQSTAARLEMLRHSLATVVLCTPSYALHMAEVAEQRNIALAELPVRLLILAGEPGGSIPAVRERIEKAWNAKVIDHAGATEVGPWGYSDATGRGLHVLESEFIAEYLSVETGETARDGELAELVLTTLGRLGSPVIRYRTGDLVRPVREHDLPCRFVLLEGGILGRIDDMLVIRGVNIFPSAVEQIVRSFPEVVEFRLTAYKRESMDRLLVEIEDRLERPERVADELRLRLGLRIEVKTVPLGTLPRFEGKGRRCVDLR